MEWHTQDGWMALTWRIAFAVPICAMVIVIMLIQRVDYGEGDGKFWETKATRLTESSSGNP